MTFFIVHHETIQYGFQEVTFRGNLSRGSGMVVLFVLQTALFLASLVTEGLRVFVFPIPSLMILPESGPVSVWEGQSNIYEWCWNLKLSDWTRMQLIRKGLT
jgi:hypothetical protein